MHVALFLYFFFFFCYFYFFFCYFVSALFLRNWRSAMNAPRPAKYAFTWLVCLLNSLCVYFNWPAKTPSKQFILMPHTTLLLFTHFSSKNLQYSSVLKQKSQALKERSFFLVVVVVVENLNLTWPTKTAKECNNNKTNLQK